MLGCGALDLAIKTSAIRESVHEGMEMIIDEQSSNTAIYQVVDERMIFATDEKCFVCLES